jgi:hypothetical protein
MEFKIWSSLNFLLSLVRSFRANFGTADVFSSKAIKAPALEILSRCVIGRLLAFSYNVNTTRLRIRINHYFELKILWLNISQ